MATYPIRQLADNGGTAQFVPVTAPEAVQFPDGSNLNTFIGSVATIESNPVAANHAVGEFLCINGQVYEVIDAITAGDSISLGENVNVANLGSQITELNNGLTNLLQVEPVAMYSGTGAYPLSSASVAFKVGKFIFVSARGTTTNGAVTASTPLLVIPYLLKCLIFKQIFYSTQVYPDIGFTLHTSSGETYIQQGITGSVPQGTLIVFNFIAEIDS